MAEAAVDQRQSRFFCHQCSVMISPTLPDYTCPRCQSGFIEMLEDERPQQEDPAARFAEYWGQALLDSLRHRRDPPGSDRRNNDSDSSDAEVDITMATDAEADEPVMTARAFPQGSHIMLRRTGTGPGAGARHPAIENIVQQLLTGLTSGTMFSSRTAFPIGTMFNLYGNPGDYAWGAGGLDSIITQLLNQLDGTGPPPASRDKIQNLPGMKITQEQVDKTLQCSVCMEDFVLDESVKRLPCNHHYHSDCIIPWLELHGTCPVCRKNLEGEDTTSGPAAGDPGIPDPEFMDAHSDFPSSSSNPSSSFGSSSSSSSARPSRDNRFDSIEEYD